MNEAPVLPRGVRRPALGSVGSAEESHNDAPRVLAIKQCNTVAAGSLKASGSQVETTFLQLFMFHRRVQVRFATTEIRA